MLDIRTPPNLNMNSGKNIKKVFLGGCIGGCNDWQNEFLEILKKFKTDETVIYNPRWDYGWTSYQQIEWEFERLKDSDIIIIWFGVGGMNRIVFYELGMWVNSGSRATVIGCDPEFDRKEDVVIQTKLARPDLKIHTNLQDMALSLVKMI